MAKTNSAKRTGKSPRKRPPVVAPTRQKPWGLIAAAVAVVVFAVGVIGYAVNKNIEASPQDPGKLAAAAAKIPDIVVKDFPGGQHSDQAIKYDSLPPFGGPHNPNWADCTGTVYEKPIRDENAVHALEHGSVWVTYKPDLPKDQVNTLKKLVEGKDHMLMSPYPGLKKPVSLQSWGHQLFVDSADDSRVKEFITDLRQNPQTTPEYGASCVNPDFKANPDGPDQDGALPLTPSPSPTPATTPNGTPSATTTPGT